MGAIEKASPASAPQVAGRASGWGAGGWPSPSPLRVHEHTPGTGTGQGGGGDLRGTGTPPAGGPGDGPVDSNDDAYFAESPSPPVLMVSRVGERARRMATALRAFSLQVMGCRGMLMITLTFSGNPDRETASGAIRDFIGRFRKSVGDYPYLWWAELQARGAVHYHVLVVDCPFLEPDRVSALWGRGFIKLRWFDGHRGFSYALKYVRKIRKAYQQDYALFALLYRFFRAYSHSRLTDTVARAFKLPAWLRSWVWRFGELPRRIPGGWEFPTSGRVVTSPWRFDGVDGDFVILRWVGSVVV